MNRNSKAYKAKTAVNRRFRPDGTIYYAKQSTGTQHDSRPQQGNRAECQIKHLSPLGKPSQDNRTKEAILASSPGSREYWKESQRLAKLDKEMSNYSSEFRQRENWQDSTKWQGVVNELGNAPIVTPLKSNAPGRVPGLSAIGWEGLAQIAAKYDLDSQAD